MCTTWRCLLLWMLGLNAAVLAQTRPEPVAAGAPAADVLEFTNGDKLTGKLEQASGGNVTFKSDMAGELTVPFNKIKQLKSGTEFVALKQGKPGHIQPEGSGAVTFEAGKVVLTSPHSEPHTLAARDLTYLIDVSSYAREVDHHATFLQGWTGSATAGLSLVRSTQTSTTFTGALNFVRAIPTVPYLPNRNRTTVNVTESYGTSKTPIIPQTTPASPASVVQTNVFHADSERDQYFTPRLFSLADISFDHNFSQGLQLQQVYGVGAGWTVVQSDTQQLDLRGDLHFEKQQFLPTGLGVVGSNGVVQDDLNLVGSTFQENYRRNLPRKFLLTEWANILPAWNDAKAYSANAYLGVTMPIFKRLSATVSATDNYLNDPSPGYRTNSIQFVTGMTYVIK